MGDYSSSTSVSAGQLTVYITVACDEDTPTGNQSTAWIPDSNQWIPDSRYWIQILCQWNRDSGFLELYSGFHSKNMLDSRFYKQKIPGFACMGQLQLLLICHLADNPLYIYTVSAPLLYWFICFVYFQGILEW